MIKMIITGHIGQDARVSPVNGKTVINFPVAVNRRVPDGNGELVEKTTWYNCAKWETREGNLFKYLKKGTQVLVEGEPEAKIYRNKENKPAIDNTLRVTMIELLGSKKENNGTAEQEDNGEWNWGDDTGLTPETDTSETEAFWASEEKQNAELAKMKAAGAGDPGTVIQKSPVEILEGMKDPFGEVESTGLSN